MSLRTPELWERALDARRAEKVNASARKVKASGPAKGPTERSRKYPITKVGDFFGELEVVAVLPRRASVSDDRVEVKCPAGHRRESFVYNLRKYQGCPQCRSKR